jgi:hypothetical protein
MSEEKIFYKDTVKKVLEILGKGFIIEKSKKIYYNL